MPDEDGDVQMSGLKACMGVGQCDNDNDCEDDARCVISLRVRLGGKELPAVRAQCLPDRPYGQSL